MRNLSMVIDNMLRVIPEDQIDFRKQLNNIKGNLFYVAPEMMTGWWDEVWACMMDNIGKELKDYWEFQVLSEFSNRTIKEIKEKIREESQ